MYVGMYAFAGFERDASKVSIIKARALHHGLVGLGGRSSIRHRPAARESLPQVCT